MDYVKHYIAPTMDDGGIVILELDETRVVVYTTNIEPVFSVDELEKTHSHGVIRLEIITDGRGQWQLVASAISTGKETLRWYENYRVWSRWFAPWKTLEIVVNSNRYKIFPDAGGASSSSAATSLAWSDPQVQGTMEFVFFRDVLTVIDGMKFTEAFVNACRQSNSHQNGKLDWNKVLGDGIDGYNIVLSEVARLLKVGVKHYGVDCNRIERLLTQTEAICTMRMTEVQNVMADEADKVSGGIQHVVNVGGVDQSPSQNNTEVPASNDSSIPLPARKVHACSLLHWQAFRDYISWIIADSKSLGRAGSPPSLQRPDSPATQQNERETVETKDKLPMEKF